MYMIIGLIVYWKSVHIFELCTFDKTRVPEENHRSATGNWQTLSHNAVSTTEKGKIYKTLHRKLEIEQHDMNPTYLL
jgi:predicted transcriptional regulator